MTYKEFLKLSLSTIVLLLFVSTTHGGYLGCFKELRRRVYTFNPGGIAANTLTPTKCTSACGATGYPYAGLAGGSFCFCSHEAPGVQLSLDADAKCSTPCEGNAADTCGSLTHIRVFTAASPITVSIDAAPKIVPVATPVTLTTDVLPTGSGFELRVDFDDNAGLTSYASNGIGLLNRKYYQAGEYEIFSYATDTTFTLADQTWSTAVLVGSKPSYVIMTCPPIMVTFEPNSCTVEVLRGTDMQITLSYTDGNPGPAVSVTFPIADATEFSFGSYVQEHLPTPTASVNSIAGLILQHGHRAQYPGTLVGFEYYAANTGTFRIYVYRPTCGGEYCYESNICVAANTCGRTCAGDYCADKHDCCATPNPPSTSLIATYTLVYTTTVTVSVSGYAFHPETGMFSVMPGDVIAHEGINPAVVANVAPGGGETLLADYYCIGLGAGPASVTSGQCVITSEMHQLKAIYAQKSDILVPFTFNNTGVVTFQATAANLDQTNIVGSATNSTTINVLEGVNASLIVIPFCIEVGVPVTLSVQPYTGTPVQVDWDFGDGNGITVVDPGSTTYTYLAPGPFNITANISNPVSWKYNQTTACVEQRITGLGISTLSTNVEVGVPVNVNLVMATGSHYTCLVTFSFSDGTKATLTIIPGNPLTFPYTFTIAGNVIISVNCSNNIATAQASYTCRAIERITGNGLTPPGAAVGAIFEIVLAWATGTDVTLNTFTYDGNAMPMTINATGRRATSDSRTESVTGVHLINYELSNPINTVTVTAATFVIETPIKNAIITCTFLNQSNALVNVPYAAIPVNSGVQCSVTMTAGTSVKVTIDYADGSALQVFNAGVGQPWAQAVGSFGFPWNHMFTVPQYCAMYVNVSNSFGSVIKNFPVWVMVGVEYVVLNPVPAVRFDPPAVLDFTFTVTSGPVPNAVTCRIEWGDNNFDEFSPCDVTKTYTHTYMDKDGDLTLTYLLKNVVSQKTGTLPVYIVTPIVNEVCYTIPKAGMPGVPFNLVFKAGRAPPPGVLDLAFDCTSDGTYELTRKRINPSPDGLDTAPCTGPRGTYTMSIKATSLLETKTCTNTYKILEPVTSAFTVLTRNNAAPIDWETTPSCAIVYQIDYTGTPLPDEAWVEIDYGNGAKSAPIAFAPTINHNYAYPAPGHYFSTIRIYNDASEQNRTVASGCYAKFLTNTIVVKREPLIPFGSPPAVGFGAAQDKFRVDENLKIIPTLPTGTFVYWEVVAESPTDMFTCNSTDKNVITFAITKFGVYTISVTPKNPLYTGPTAKSVIEMIVPVDNISISDNGLVVNAYQNKNFSVTMVNYGTAMCVAAFFGDIEKGYNVERYGDNATCADKAVINAQFTAHGTPIIMDGTPTDVSKPFTLYHQYTKQGTFKLEVYAWNVFSSDYAQFTFAISGINCAAPNIDIKNRTRNFRYPAEYRRSKRIKVIGITDIACPNTLQNTKLWTAIQWNQTMNTQINVIDTSGVPSAINSELAFDPLFLPYGLYKLVYKVTMLTKTPTGEQFSSSSDTFIKVVPSDVVVQLFENSMSLKSVGPNVLLTLSPRDNSYDPDIDKSKGEIDTFDSFKMACRDMTLNEAFPAENVLVTPMNLTDIPGGHVDTGGCFQSGAGWLDKFSGSVTFWTSILKVDHTYEFKVIGTKDTRSAEFIGRLEVKSADPPSFTIEFKIKNICNPSPGGKKFNPNSQLGLLANLLVPCPACTYLWEMFAYDYQYCGPTYNCWRNLAYLGRYIQGSRSEELTVMTEVFSHYDTVDDFQMRLGVTDTTTGVTGNVYLNLTRNHPPVAGNCTIDPLNGIALFTNFTIHCSGFSDDDGIVFYRIKCKGRGPWADVASGDETHWEARYLPVGDPSNANIVTCNAEVTDSLGAIGTYPIENVTVNPMPMVSFRDDLKNMLSDERDQTDLIDAVANLDMAVGYIMSMTSMLGEMSETDEQSDFQGMGTILSFTRTGLDSNGTRPSVFTTEVEDPEKLLEYENVRDAGAQLLQKLTHTLMSTTVESTAETMRQADAISKMTTSTAYLTRDALATMTELLERGIDNMRNNMDSMTVEEIEEIGQTTLDACNNIEQAAVLTADYPTNTDVETQAEAVINFDSNLDSTLGDVGNFDNDQAALRDGKMIYNKDVQNNFATSNLMKCALIQQEIVNILADRKPKSPEPTIMKSPSYEAAVFKNDAKNLVNQSLTAGGCKVDIPSDLFPSDSDNETFIMTVSAKASTGAPLEEHGPVDKYSRELSISFKYPNGTARRIDNLPTPVTLKISQDPFKPKLNLSALDYANPQIVPTREDEYLFYHQLVVNNQRAAILLTFRPNNISYDNQLLVLVNHEELPDLDWGRTKVKHVCMIPSDTSLTGFYGSDTEPDPYSCFVDADIVGNLTGAWRIGVRQLLIDEQNRYTLVNHLPREVPQVWKDNKEFYTDYIFSASEITCAYMEEGSSVRRNDGVKPSPLSTENAVQCETTHLTTFAGGWVVAPNTIDWNFVFSNADFFKNPTLYVTEIVIAVFYIIAMIWSRRKDKQDLEKLGLAPLLDNEPRDKYYYEIMVSTGMRRGAGTESKVHFILSGEEEETEVRTFEDKKRKIFTRGSTDGFLMSVPDPLGALMYLRIWHDNSGRGRAASWYLNHVIVRDVQTDKKYYFIANRWFAVEEDDGQVDRVIPVAGKEQMTEFSHLFSEKATKNLSDGHLWFSVVARPPNSRFTRCQRVSCCLCLLFTSMLANAMFYGTETSDSSAFQFGPFALTSQQVFIGVVCNLIIFPVNFILVMLFRKSRPRKLRPSRVEEALKSIPERSTSMADLNLRSKSSLETERPGSSSQITFNLTNMKRPESSMSMTQTRIVEPNKKKKCELPWWFVIVGWILLWAATLVSAAFVTFYGIMFQDIMCKKWITSMLISFFTSVFLTQPIKVFLFAIIFSLIIKNPGNDDEEDDDEEAPRKLEQDEEYLHEEDEFGFVSPRRPLYKPKPPDMKSLEKARQQRLKEIQMWAVIREIIFYAFFLWILLVISYRSVSVLSYRYKFNMEKVFILTNDTDHSFTAVTNTEDFWDWARSGMLRGIRAGPYYNNFPPFYMRGYIDDKQSRLMGYAVLRQLRTKSNTCTLPRVMEGVMQECNGDYDMANEEEGNFGVGWTQLGFNNSREEYTYKSGSELNGYPYWGIQSLYSGGGYVYKLNKDYVRMISDLDQLRAEGWIDKYTRAVFLEFTVYNPSINMFAVSTLLAEFQPNGGVLPSYRFEPCNLLPYMNSGLLFQIACEIIYVGFTLFFIIKEIRYMIKQKREYFFEFWNLVDLGIAAMSVTAIVIYFYRLFCIKQLTEYFKETHGNEYMKFQYVGYWSEIFNYIIGFLVFFATLKFLKLLRFNKKISLLSDTLRNSSKDLIHFSIIFNVVFLAFIQVFYLVYMSHLPIFRSFLSSCESGLVMMMGKFDINTMLGVNQWLTQIFIFLFVVTVTFIVVNMLLSILNDTFSAVRNDKAKQENDYEIIEFMLGRFKMWTGIGRGNTTINPSEMEEREKNYKTLEGQIEYFPDQIDRFLSSISHMYIGNAKFDDFLQKGMAKKMAMKAHAQEIQHPAPAAPRVPGAQRLSNGARGMTDVQTD